MNGASFIIFPLNLSKWLRRKGTDSSWKDQLTGPPLLCLGSRQSLIVTGGWEGDQMTIGKANEGCSFSFTLSQKLWPLMAWEKGIIWQWGRLMRGGHLLLFSLLEASWSWIVAEIKGALPLIGVSIPVDCFLSVTVVYEWSVLISSVQCDLSVVEIRKPSSLSSAIFHWFHGTQVNT